MLAAERQRLVARLTDLDRVLTLPVYLPPDAGWLSGVSISIPNVAPNGDPMGFMSENGVVIMPLTGLKFIEDLTMAYAWRYSRGQTLEPFDEYLAMLRWKPEAEWPGGVYSDPLKTFGVPPGAWDQDQRLAGLGTSLRNEAWAFILAHELAHVYYSHPGNSVPPKQVQANERQADAFALDLLERTETIPMGAILYFQATVAFYASRVDLPSDRAYAVWQREQATHPVNSQRLLTIARHLQLEAKRQSGATRAEVLSFIGNRLEQFATDLDDPAMQQLVARRAIFGNPADLKDR
ncbi:ImmA/IrrE family metallo-endopeptidase [Mesorhizobium yinganensis]|uniref:ImmA/IrrE family metallo-endopeptidase n=1 Tax=Mesorhizobium yinganensis TaxID=3157707 RepID=UPI0032B7C883